MKHWAINERRTRAMPPMDDQDRSAVLTLRAAVGGGIADFKYIQG